MIAVVRDRDMASSAGHMMLCEERRDAGRQRSADDPVLLFLGLATRIATLPLLGMIAVIQIFVYPNAYNEHLVWGAILALLRG